METNAGFDIDGRAGVSYGVALTGNMFSHALRSAPNLIPGRWYQIDTNTNGTNWVALGAANNSNGTIFQCNSVGQTGTDSAYEFSVLWGTGCVSVGNFHAMAMHSLVQGSSQVYIADVSNAAIANVGVPLPRWGTGANQMCTYQSRRTDSGYIWTFGEGSTKTTAKHFGITCDSESGSPWLDINGTYGNLGIGGVNPRLGEYWNYCMDI